MSGIVDKSGKPIEKKWTDMDIDEKLDVLRQGIGALINQGNAMGVAVGRLMKALDESEAEFDKNSDLPQRPELVPAEPTPTKVQTGMAGSGLDQVPQ